MKWKSILPLFALAGVSFGADAPGVPTVSQIFDRQVSMVEREVVSLAKAMPADKYGFAPKDGAFDKVRTFGQQVSHIAVVINAAAASVLQEEVPAMGSGENGPESLKSKDQIVKYLEDSFAYAHKAMNSLTDGNLRQMIKPAFGTGLAPRLSMVTVPVWHTFDHYGQMVVYARMNGVIPGR